MGDIAKEGWGMVWNATFQPTPVAVFHIPKLNLDPNEPDVYFDVDRVSFTKTFTTALGTFAQVAFFNDSMAPHEDWPPTCPWLGVLDVTEIEIDFGKTSLYVTDISEAVFGTHTAFDSLPELTFIPCDEFMPRLQSVVLHR